MIWSCSTTSFSASRRPSELTVSRQERDAEVPLQTAAVGLVLPDGGGRVVPASRLGGSVSADFPENPDVPPGVGQRAAKSARTWAPCSRRPTG